MALDFIGRILTEYFRQTGCFFFYVILFYFILIAVHAKRKTWYSHNNIWGLFCMICGCLLLLSAVVVHWWEYPLKPSTVHFKNTQNPEYLSLSQYLQIRPCFLLKSFPQDFFTRWWKSFTLLMLSNSIRNSGFVI